MKNQFYFIASLVIGMLLPTFAFSQQRSVDLKVIVTTPANQDSIEWGDTAKCSFYIKNNGPDSFLVADTAQLKVWQYNLPMFGLNIAPGDSIIQNNAVKLWNDDSSEDAIVDFCVFIKKTSSGFSDPDHSNDSSCVTFALLGKQMNTSIQRQEEPFEAIRVAPNPTKNKVNLYFPFKIKGKIKLKIVDLLGRVDLNKNRFSIQNKALSIDVSNLKSGIYIFQVQTSRGVFSEKVVIQN